MDYNTSDVYLRNCTPPAIDDFPAGWFTESQRQHGAIVVHAFISIYLFLALAVVCDKFFVPAVDRICQAVNMSNDVAGATFMAATTSAPELFVNVIGTFITEGDIGVGTIVGSAVFNILAVAACCGIGAGMVVPLDWWPLTRDCLAYGITVSILICIMHDEYVQWYEAFLLVMLYGVYICIMYYDKSIQNFARGSWKCVSNMLKKQEEKGDNIIEAKEGKPPIAPNKTESLPERHQHNGNIKILQDKVGKMSGKAQDGDFDKNVNVEIEVQSNEINEMDIVCVDPIVNEDPSGEPNKESVDEYQHSFGNGPVGEAG